MPSSHLASFMPRRYDELVGVLHAHGFDLADNTHPLYPNTWNDEPPVGLVRVKGVWLPHADRDDDADEDSRVTMTFTEWWADEKPPYATVEREGMWLAGYGYNGHIAGHPAGDGRRNHRHDFDVMKEPAKVFHLHPLGERNHVKHAEQPVIPEQAIADLLSVVSAEIAAGVFQPLP